MKLSTTPFIRIEKDVVVVLSIIRSETCRLNPKLCRVDWRKIHSTLSYALYISILIFNAPSLPLILFIEWNSSFVVITLSEIYLPTTKAFWLGDISLWRIGFILLARILVITLYSTLQRVIGYNQMGIRQGWAWAWPW